MAEESPVKRMSIAEFRELGFLQEANRLFFHPRGLALEVVTDDETGATMRLGGIWDYREDPEGITYSDDMIDPEKIERVQAELERHRPTREEMFGSVVQGGADDLDERGAT